MLLKDKEIVYNNYRTKLPDMEICNMSEKIVLIDGHSILNRAFFGIPDLTNAEGLHTNAITDF